MNTMADWQTFNDQKRAAANSAKCGPDPCGYNSDMIRKSWPFLIDERMNNYSAKTVDHLTEFLRERWLLLSGSDTVPPQA